MPSQQPVCAARPTRVCRSLWWNHLRDLLSAAAALWALGLGRPAACPAAETLWLNHARASITTSELHGHVSTLADDMLEGREAGSRGGRVAAKYILQRLEAAKLAPAGDNGSYVQVFRQGYQNLLAVLPGTDPELRDEHVLICAHYDHVGYGTRRNSYGPWGYIHNGADDNASGVSALLEVIDALAHTEHRPRRSILFAFWDGEEKGLLGSQHWKRQPTLSLAGVKLAINLDMVGRLTDGRIEVGGTRSALGSRQLMSSATLEEPLWLDFNWEYKNNSDHWTFYEAGIASLYVHTGVHEDYHRPSDDVEKLNVDGIRLVSGYVLEQLCEAADCAKLPSFRGNAISETPSTQRRLEQPLPPLADRLDFRWKYVASQPPSVAVEGVPWSSPAKQAGLQPGDRIVAVNGQPLLSEATLPAIALRAAEPLQLQIERSAASDPLELTIPLVGTPTQLGLSWRSDEAEPTAVYITRVVPYSPAALAGIQVHDRLYTLNDQTVGDAEQLLERVRQLLANGEDTLHFEVESRGKLRDQIISLGLPAASPQDATL